MRSHLIVLDPPALDDCPRLREALEPVHVQAFVAQLAVEGLDESVVHRTAWSPLPMAGVRRERNQNLGRRIRGMPP